MIILKTKPVGVDIPIQHFQQYLYPQLLTTWNLADADYTCYGRAYRNQTADGYTPEVYDGSDPQAIEYKEVLFDDTLKALSFFALGEDVKYDRGDSNAPVALIFMVNVPALKPGFTYRADEEIRNDVEKLCQIDRFEFRMTDFITGIDQVFKEYSGWKKKDGVKYRDMHPTHCFRLNFNVLFDINDCFLNFKIFDR